MRVRPACRGTTAEDILNVMTRYVIDAPTLLNLVSTGLRVDASHQIVARSVIRSQALALQYAACAPVTSPTRRRSSNTSASPR